MRITTTRNQVETQILDDVKNSNVFPNHKYTPLSKVYTFIRAMANAVYLFIDQTLVSLQKALHPHTAEETDLHEWLKRYGLSWKQARKAIHTIRIGSTEPVFFPIEIPQGTIIHTDGNGIERNQIKFQTLENVILPKNITPDSRSKYTVQVQAECLLFGEIGNVNSDTITLIEDNIDGIDVVYNANNEPTVLGVERETITEVRERLRVAEGAVLNKFTPDWYISVVQQHPNVARAIFRSSREIGIPGAVKIFLLGRAGNLTEAEMLDIKNNLESDENNPGGAAHVLLENFTTIEVNKTITVQFADLQSIPSQDYLDEVADRYFIGLGEGVDFLDATLRTMYFNQFPFAVNVIVDPMGNIAVNEKEVAIKGSGFNVIGEVYEV